VRFEVDAILFDIDGTLVDSTAVVERIWRTWATSWDIDVAEILRVCHGRRSQDTIALFLPLDRRAEATEELAQLELQDVEDVEDVVALPEADEMLRSLAAERSAAVTSGSRELMEARLGAANLAIPRSWWLVRMSATANPIRRGTSRPRRASRRTSDGVWSSKTRRPAWREAWRQERECSPWRRRTRGKRRVGESSSCRTSPRASWSRGPMVWS
jgi:hypothetical protein